LFDKVEYMTATQISPQALIQKTETSELRLKDIIRSIPKEYFLKDARKAWTKVVVNTALVALGYWSLAVAPIYLLPLCWIFTGTALTGFFVIAHDCGHRSFSNRRWVNDLVGHIALLPILYPFHSWRHLHDKHHKHTNKMDVDNAWQPLRPELYDELPTIERVVYRAMRERLWFIGSIFHWALIHFKRSNYRNEQQWKDAQFSNAVVIIAGAIGLPLLVAMTGVTGLINFWLMPWMVYHFWMSTFTIVHHTLPNIPFQEPENWNEAESQLFGTVHCDYPRWVEFMCHDINVHIPHHISTAIPSYNLRKVHRHFQGIWGSQLIERKFNWALMQEVNDCHLYHPVRFYQTFREHGKG
jgi:acyl-lipid omega-6 desaturase (Delta-12 desaturase)